MRRIAPCLVLLAACGRSRAPSSEPPAPALAAPPDAPARVEEEAPAVAPSIEPAPEADVRALVRGVERLAWRLWPAASSRPGNRVLSPASVAVSLAMASAVERGAAADEVRAELAPELDAARMHRAAGTLLRAWQSEPSDGGGLLAVQRVFVDRAVRFEDGPTASLRTLYGAPEGVVDTGAPEGARRRIDGFIAARTRGAVRGVVPELAVVADAPAMVASGALARFACEGDVSTVRFRVGGVAPSDARSARCRGAVSSARADGFTLLRVPARGGAVALDVVLPDEGRRLADVEARLDEASVRAAISALRPGRAAVNLPTVRVANESPEGLRNDLMGRGPGMLFDPERSDLARPGERGGWVSELYHRARFEADVAAEGDAPAPAFGLVTYAVDRPFLFVLRDARLDTPLAIGHVVDPGE